MSDEVNPEDAVQNDVGGMRKTLEKQGKELAEAREALATHAKNDAFRAAGVPEGEPGSVWDMFRNGYAGDLEADAIKAAKDKLGIPEVAPTQDVPPVETAPTAEQRQEAAALSDMSAVRQEFSEPANTSTSAIEELLAKAQTPADIEAAMDSVGLLSQYD